MFHKIITLLKLIPETEAEAPSLLPLALDAWELLVRRLPHDILGRELTQIVAELLAYFHEPYKARVHGILKYLLVEQAQQLKAHTTQIALFLPDDLGIIQPLQTPLVDRIRALLPFVEADKHRPLRVRVLAFEKLAKILHEGSEPSADLARLLGADPLPDELVQVVAACLRGIKEKNSTVHLLCSKILGLIGALDPQRVMLPPTRAQDYAEKDTHDLARLLLEGPVGSAYRHATDPVVLDKCAYVIQELLKTCGCDEQTPWERGDIKAVDFWKSLAEDTRENIQVAPFPSLPFSPHSSPS